MAEPDLCRCAAGSLTGALLVVALVASACEVLPYQPLLVTPVGGLPDNAFRRARHLLLDTWGALREDDAAGFRLQTPWQSCQRAGTPGRRRATVFLAEPGSLGVVVEVSWLTQDLLGDFGWSAVRGDPHMERELGHALRKAMQ